jgi:hypothetical protein
MLSAARLDAFVHASRHGCEPGIPLVQPEAINLVKPPGILMVDCPAGCGIRLSVPLAIVDILSVDSDGGDLDARFVAEACELHDYLDAHLQTCTRHKAAG